MAMGVGVGSLTISTIVFGYSAFSFRNYEMWKKEQIQNNSAEWSVTLSLYYFFVEYIPLAGFLVSLIQSHFSSLKESQSS